MATLNPSPKSEEKMIFKCDKHAAIISEKLLSFYEKDEFFDIVLIAGTQSVNIQAHRVVLCALSEYFLEKFRGVHTALQGNVVVLIEIDASMLKLVIDFMYTGCIELSMGTVEELLRIALFLKMGTLVEGCCDFIEQNMNSSNSLQWLRFANELSLPILKSKSLECIYTHFEEISTGKQLLILNEIELKDLLFNDNPHGDFEEAVFLSMVAWINYDKPNREQLTFELLSMVRFWALTPKFIVENRKSVCKTVESYELICSWLQWHLSPESRSNDQPNCDLKPRKKPGKLAVVGIFNHEEIKIQALNPKENSWSIEMKKYLPSKRKYSSTIVIDNKLLVVGGKDNIDITNRVGCLDMQTLEWIDFPPMNKRRQLCQLADLNGHLCAFKGDIDIDHTVSMEIYNFSTRKWHDVQPLSSPSRYSKIAAHNGMLLILDFTRGVLQSYDVSSNQWTCKAVKQCSLHSFGFVAIEGFLYVIGGIENREFVTTVKRYDLSNDSWREMASLQTGRYVNSNVFGKKITICGGRIVEEYNIDTDTWITLGSLPVEIDELYLSNIFTWCSF